VDGEVSTTRVSFDGLLDELEEAVTRLRRHGFVVRGAPSSATIALLGDRNWWLPGWLDRILPNVNIEGEHGLPEPEYVIEDRPVAIEELVSSGRS
jgi:hypothetical protein